MQTYHSDAYAETRDEQPPSLLNRGAARRHRRPWRWVLLGGVIVALAVGGWRWRVVLTGGSTRGLRAGERCLASLDGPCLEHVLAGADVDESNERWRTLMTESWLTAQAVAAVGSKPHPLPTLPPARGADINPSLRDRGALWYSAASASTEPSAKDRASIKQDHAADGATLLSQERVDHLSARAANWLREDSLGAAGPHLRARAARLLAGSGETRLARAGSAKTADPPQAGRKAADLVQPPSAFSAVEYHQSAVAEFLCLQAQEAPDASLSRADMAEVRASQQAGLLLGLCLASLGRQSESDQLFSRLAQQSDSPPWLETLRERLAQGIFPSPPPLAFER